MALWAIPAAIAGAGLLGNILGQKSQEKATAATNAANAAINDQNTQLQREFAQNGIRWKVEDAKAAGIHPLVGLGAQTASFAPSSIGHTPDFSKSDMMKNMGQDVGRAISATRTSAERRISELNIQGAELDIQGKALDNQIKQSQLRKLEAVGPAMPGSSSFISGQGDSGPGILERPMERTASLKGAPHSEPGAVTDLGWAKTKTGVVPVPSKDVKERTEDVMPHELMHFYRNNIKPNFGGGTKPPRSALPRGYDDWEWNFWDQEYQAVKGRAKTPWQKWSDSVSGWQK